MYCVKCGVKLADTEQNCPLCGTVVFHPDLDRNPEAPLYPARDLPSPGARSRAPQILMTLLFFLPLLTVLLCDLEFSRRITWSGYVVGALFVGYVVLILPAWFRSPNPVIFVPCSFAAAAIYLLYINFAVGGHWFLSFALPITGGTALIVTTVIVLLRNVRRGRLYIFGGASIAFGLLMLLLEFLMSITFDGIQFIGWSFYPMNALAMSGGFLIFLGIYRPARETMERLFFL